MWPWSFTKYDPFFQTAQVLCYKTVNCYFYITKIVLQVV